ncbi:MAG: hypothetical protein PHG51_05495 [Candidatus Omnitrophica bacterium]|nr:hypothetical protein [Candidatus Omnitrophota bacterium]
MLDNERGIHATPAQRISSLAEKIEEVLGAYTFITHLDSGKKVLAKREDRLRHLGAIEGDVLILSVQGSYSTDMLGVLLYIWQEFFFDIGALEGDLSELISRYFERIESMGRALEENSDFGAASSPVEADRHPYWKEKRWRWGNPPGTILDYVKRMKNPSDIITKKEETEKFIAAVRQWMDREYGHSTELLLVAMQKALISLYYLNPQNIYFIIRDGIRGMHFKFGAILQQLPPDLAADMFEYCIEYASKENPENISLIQNNICEEWLLTCGLVPHAVSRYLSDGALRYIISGVCGTDALKAIAEDKKMKGNIRAELRMAGSTRIDEIFKGDQDTRGWLKETFPELFGGAFSSSPLGRGIFGKLAPLDEQHIEDFIKNNPVRMKLLFELPSEIQKGILSERVNLHVSLYYFIQEIPAVSGAYIYGKFEEKRPGENYLGIYFSSKELYELLGAIFPEESVYYADLLETILCYACEEAINAKSHEETIEAIKRAHPENIRETAEVLELIFSPSTALNRGFSALMDYFIKNTAPNYEDFQTLKQELIKQEHIMVEQLKEDPLNRDDKTLHLRRPLSMLLSKISVALVESGRINLAEVESGLSALVTGLDLLSKVYYELLKENAFTLEQLEEKQKDKTCMAAAWKAIMLVIHTRMEVFKDTVLCIPGVENSSVQFFRLPQRREMPVLNSRIWARLLLVKDDDGNLEEAELELYFSCRELKDNFEKIFQDDLRSALEALAYFVFTRSMLIEKGEELLRAHRQAYDQTAEKYPQIKDKLGLISTTTSSSPITVPAPKEIALPDATVSSKARKQPLSCGNGSLQDAERMFKKAHIPVWGGRIKEFLRKESSGEHSESEIRNYIAEYYEIEKETIREFLRRNKGKKISREEIILSIKENCILLIEEAEIIEVINFLGFNRTLVLSGIVPFSRRRLNFFKLTMRISRAVSLLKEEGYLPTLRSVSLKMKKDPDYLNDALRRRRISEEDLGGLGVKNFRLSGKPPVNYLLLERNVIEKVKELKTKDKPVNLRSVSRAIGRSEDYLDGLLLSGEINEDQLKAWGVEKGKGGGTPYLKKENIKKQVRRAVASLKKKYRHPTLAAVSKKMGNDRSYLYDLIKRKVITPAELNACGVEKSEGGSLPVDLDFLEKKVREAVEKINETGGIPSLAAVSLKMGKANSYLSGLKHDKIITDKELEVLGVKKAQGIKSLSASSPISEKDAAKLSPDQYLVYAKGCLRIGIVPDSPHNIFDRPYWRNKHSDIFRLAYIITFIHTKLRNPKIIEGLIRLYIPVLYCITDLFLMKN